ncbi:hypothetical protein BKA93DRAFT_355907 [Sparassis latifolia]
MVVCWFSTSLFLPMVHVWCSECWGYSSKVPLHMCMSHSSSLINCSTYLSAERGPSFSSCARNAASSTLSATPGRPSPASRTFSFSCAPGSAGHTIDIPYKGTQSQGYRIYSTSIICGADGESQLTAGRSSGRKSRVNVLRNAGTLCCFLKSHRGDLKDLEFVGTMTLSSCRSNSTVTSPNNASFVTLWG